ncbi:hypothetical protein EOM89_05225 [Candidatus Falkowbacteria bacterium]|nr:hypothetical protein [Candidatus Falkowbacteria bacterium]
MKYASLLAGLVIATAAAADEKPVFTVYAPDYFASDWGPGPAIEKGFEETCGCDLRFVTGDVLPRILLEGAATEADAVIGLNTDVLARARATGLFAPHGQDTARLTLPVVFLMLSNHYPLAFASAWNWAIASLVFLMGVTIRHWFNCRHAGTGSPWWTWIATVAVFALIVWLSIIGTASAQPVTASDTSPAVRRFAEAAGFDAVTEIVVARCSMCHAAEPIYPGIARAPKAVVLEAPAQIAREARRIYVQAGLTHAMPPGNLTFVEPEERARIVRWYRAARAGS